jgi:hypothetical protein
MTLREEVEKALSETKEELSKRPEFKRLNDFYETMKREGVIRPKEYDLPQLDTVGRRLYRDINSKTRSKG